MIVHLNGELLPLEQARISPLDRGFLFGDGVYEGLRAIPDFESNTRIVGLGLHVNRMQAGLDEAGIAWDAACLGPASRELLHANNLRDAFVYWQVSRGTPVAGEPIRSRVPAPGSAMKPTVFGYCTPQPPLDSIVNPPVKRAIVCEDIRWRLGHLKSISLMGNVVTAIRADRHGGDEAVMVRSGIVTEGLATNIILAHQEQLSTPSLDSVPILAGITRSILLRAAPDICEQTIPVADLETASEIMLIGTTTLVTSITHLDGRTINDGSPGPAARRLLKSLLSAIHERRDDW